MVAASSPMPSHHFPYFPGFPMMRPLRSADSTWNRILAALLLLLTLASALRAEEDATVEKRIADCARYLTSDELEGRGLKTKGIDLAADYIGAQFSQSGLKTDLFDGKPFQKFTVTTGQELAKDNKLVLVGPPAKEGENPQSIEVKLGKDYTPLSLSGVGNFDRPLVFAGYGITAPKEGYDDYAGLNVEGKIVVLLRHEPQQNDPQSAFDGTRDSPHAWLTRKVANAQEHKAAGILFCTDEVQVLKAFAADRKKWHEALDKLTAEHENFKKVQSPTLEQIEAQRKRIDELLRQIDAISKKLQDDHDPVLAFYVGDGQPRPDFPVLHCRRTVLDRMVKAALNTDLAKLEEEIDRGPKPQSRELTGWRAAGRADIQRTQTEAKNVIAVLPGEGPHAEETVVVGAHYDHIGFGGAGSLSRGVTAVHPGADDNASGVTVMLEVARVLAARQPKLPRRVVFIAFTGEESGLLGSNHYVQHPLVPLDKTVAMLNLDMVGRLRDDRLTVIGSNTAKPFGDLLDKANEHVGLKLGKVPSGPGASDQTAFYVRQVPVMHFFTGMHGEYHRTSDKFETLNVAGMRRVAQLVEDVTAMVASVPSRPEFVAAGPAKMIAGDGTRPFFGSMPDFGSGAAGYTLGGVVKDGPAEKAGLKAGDSVIEFGDAKITGLEDFDAALRKHKAGDRVRTVVRRGEQSVAVEVTLDPPR